LSFQKKLRILKKDKVEDLIRRFIFFLISSHVIVFSVVLYFWMGVVLNGEQIKDPIFLLKRNNFVGMHRNKS
jgi:hypothetical protein